MSVLAAQDIRRIRPVEPFMERTVIYGMTYGLGPCSYDIRVAESFTIFPGDFWLASSMEKFMMPDNVMARVADKSSWARKGIAVQNTVIEPGWRGFLTLEITSHNMKKAFNIAAGSPIAAIIFEELTQPTELPYSGKYQDQKAGPQDAIEESNT